jgi:hypothetical protein
MVLVAALGAALAMPGVATADQGDRPAGASGVLLVTGEVASVDAAAGTMDIEVYGMRGPGGGQQGQPPQGGNGPQSGCVCNGQQGGNAPQGQQGGAPQGQPQQAGGGPQGQPPQGGDRPRPPRDPNGQGPTGQAAQNGGADQGTRHLTVHVDANTDVSRNGSDAALADIQAGDLVHVAWILGDQPPRDAVNGTAFMVAAWSKPDLYGFAGRITGVDAGAGTITMHVRKANAKGQPVVAAKGSDLTFKVDDNTTVLVNHRRAQAGDLKVGDRAAVGIAAPPDATADEVLATPANVVLALVRPLGPQGLGRLCRQAANAAGA